MGCGSLNAQTLALLKSRPHTVTYSSLADQTGVDAYWIRSYVQGRIKHPPVDRVQALYEALTGRELAF